MRPFKPRIGSIVYRDGVLHKIVEVWPLYKRVKYGKEYVPAKKQICQIYENVFDKWCFSTVELKPTVEFKFNIGEIVILQCGQYGMIESQHGGWCPWYKVRIHTKGKVHIVPLYEGSLSKLNLGQKDSMILSLG